MGIGGPITGPFCFWFPRRSPSPGVSRFPRLVSGASVYLAGAMKVNSKTKSRYMSLGILESSWSIPKLAMCWLIHENQKMRGMQNRHLFLYSFVPKWTSLSWKTTCLFYYFPVIITCLLYRSQRNICSSVTG